MDLSRKKHSELLGCYVWALVIVWTLVVAGLLFFDIQRIQQATHETMLNEGRTHFKRDLAFRLWATSHGGVYVPTDERTPPNPYLSHIPERDIVTPSGKRLTFMNPAYALRQMNEDFTAMFGIPARITSLKPLRPENAPDEWERKALQALERGKEEVYEPAEIEGESFLRFMQPLITKQGCLKCHGHQGYRVGDVRGGISLAVPFEPFWSKERRTIAVHVASLGLLWVFGLAGIFVGSGKLRKRIQEREKAERAVEESEGNLKRAQEIAHIGSWYLDLTKNELRWSDETYRIFGVPPGSPITYERFLGMVHPDDREYVDTSWKAALKRAPYDIEHRIAVDGTVKWIREMAELEFNEEGKAVHGTGTIQDITELRKAEAISARFGMILNESLNEIYIFDAQSLHFMLVNEGARINIGYSMEELKNLTPLDLETGYTAESFAALIEPLRSGAEKIIRFSTNHRRKDDTYYEVEVNLQTTDYEDRPAFVAVMLDITERKKAEEELEKYSNTLEELVGEKTKELNERVFELERYREATTDRELRMKELRDKITELEKNTKG